MEDMKDLGLQYWESFLENKVEKLGDKLTGV